MSARVLADTAIWIDHINQGHERLAFSLSRRRVVMHATIIGEVALGSLQDRSILLNEVAELPRIASASDDEVVRPIEQLDLSNKGIGYVDAHLVVAARAGKAGILTRDKRLHQQAERLGIAHAG